MLHANDIAGHEHNGTPIRCDRSLVLCCPRTHRCNLSLKILFAIIIFIAFFRSIACLYMQGLVWVILQFILPSTSYFLIPLWRRHGRKSHWWETHWGDQISHNLLSFRSCWSFLEVIRSSFFVHIVYFSLRCYFADAPSIVMMEDVRKPSNRKNYRPIETFAKVSNILPIFYFSHTFSLLVLGL